MMVRTTAREVRLLSESINEFQERIEQLFALHPDQDLFASFPGAGKVLAPRLCAVMGQTESRYASPEEIQEFSGIAPVTERSGKSNWVHRRFACPQFFHQTFVEYAKQSIRAIGMGESILPRPAATVAQVHNAALRALAFKWIRIIYRCWMDRVPYNEQTYQTTLVRHGSPLARNINGSALPA